MRLFSIRLFAFLATLSLSFGASSAEITCDRIAELKQYSLSGCDCGKSLSRLPISSPKGLSLIAACDFQKKEFVGVVGQFFFKGDATVKGEVKRVASQTFGDSITFEATSPGRDSQFASAIRSLKFRADPGIIQKFRLPPVSEESPCQAAEATIRVRLLEVQAGDESDAEGNYPQQFEVLKVGPYIKCEPPEEEEVVEPELD